MKKIMFLLLAAPLFFFACSDDNTEDSITDATQSITVDATEGLHFEVPGGKSVVTVTSSGDWRLVGRKTWCKPSVEAGKNGDAVTFTAEPNLSEEDRTLTYSFVCGSKVSKIEVTQKGNNLLIVPQRTYKVPAGGETVSVKIRATVPVVRVVSEEGKNWITDVTVSEPSTDGNPSFLKFRVAPNTTYGDHAATVSLQYSEGLAIELTFSQPQNDAILLDKNPALYEFDEKGGEFSVKVSANVEYSVDIPEMDRTWLSIKPKSRALTDTDYTFVVTEAGTAARFTEVHFVSADGKIDTKLTVRQSGKPVPPLVIPDAKLRTYLANQGYINVLAAPNCEITEKGLAATTISLQRGGVYDLTGLNAFVNLTTIDVRNNYFTHIDLTGLTKLATLQCDNNKLESVIIDDEAPLQNLEMSMLRGEDYAYSTAIVFSGANIKKIEVYYNSQLRTVDISACPGLTYFDCEGIANPSTLYMKTGQTIATLYKSGYTTIVYK